MVDHRAIFPVYRAVVLMANSMADSEVLEESS